MAKPVVVVGTGFRNPDGRNRADLIRRHCKPGMLLHLIREPTNPHDANAVAVHIDTPKVLGIFGGSRVQIGYLREGVARSVAKRLDAGNRVTGVITSMHAPAGFEHPRVSAELTYHEATS